MRTLAKLCLFLLMPGLVIHAQTPVFNVIPQPDQYKLYPGAFELNPQTVILVPENEQLHHIVKEFSAHVKQVTGFEPAITDITPLAPAINFIMVTLHDSDTMLGKEGYSLLVEKNRVILMAQHPAGIFRGIQTIRQLLPPQFNGKQCVSPQAWRMPCAKIIDKPRFPWRGMLLDCSRHFMEKAFVKRYIDLLAFHKMNTLHWHLTEDQGWRIEIEKYPRLTSVGAWRKADGGGRYGGFYTRDDIREIVAYAKRRYINIVPEIELPGHSQAALAAYPEYSCTGGPFEVQTEWGVFKEIYCAGNDSTFVFLENILAEVIDLFPGPYIHIGGDEVPKYRWEHCPKCQTRMKQEGLKDEHELQAYFIKRIGAFLTSRGKTLIGWDEILEGGLAEGAIVQSWRGFDGAVEAAKMGHPVIVSPTSHAYFDYDIKAIDLEKVYSFDPIPADLKPDEAKWVLGGECNMWTERAPQSTVDSKVFPRILAMVEVLWNYPEKRDFEKFYDRVQLHYRHLDQLGVSYGLEAIPVSMSAQWEAAGFKVALDPRLENLQIYYTLDGDSPTAEQAPYRTPFHLQQSATVKALAYKNNKAYGDVMEYRIAVHKASGRFPGTNVPVSPNYTGGGKGALTDGFRGSLDFRDGHWQGYQGNDLEVRIDLGKPTEISGFSTAFYQYNNAWIFLPERIDFSLSTDGKHFELAASLKNDIPATKRGQFIKEFNGNFAATAAQYIKMEIKQIGKCPDWHEAAGSAAWIFIDEIIVQ